MKNLCYSVRQKCYSVRLESLVSITDLAFKAVAYNGSEAVIPKSEVYGQDFEVTKCEAYWISDFILEDPTRNLQYSSKKVKWF